MIAVIQRVSEARVLIGGSVVSEIGKGLLVLVGVEVSDRAEIAVQMAKKIYGLRIFDDEQGKMNLSVEQVGGDYMLVSQFTLCADTSKGKRPGFENAMKPPQSEKLFNAVVKELEALAGKQVKTGKFGESMEVQLVNNGPATFVLKT